MLYLLFDSSAVRETPSSAARTQKVRFYWGFVLSGESIDGSWGLHLKNLTGHQWRTITDAIRL